MKRKRDPSGDTLLCSLCGSFRTNTRQGMSRHTASCPGDGGLPSHSASNAAEATLGTPQPSISAVQLAQGSTAESADARPVAPAGSTPANADQPGVDDPAVLQHASDLQHSQVDSGQLQHDSRSIQAAGQAAQFECMPMLESRTTAVHSKHAQHTACSATPQCCRPSPSVVAPPQ